jgi:uncharacterized membrane protein
VLLSFINTYAALISITDPGRKIYLLYLVVCVVCVVGFMVIYFTFMETKGSILEGIHQVAADWKTVKRSLRRREVVVGKVE